MQEGHETLRRAQNAEKRLECILEVVKLINSSQELNEMIYSILTIAKKVLNAQGASMFMLDKKKESFYFASLAGIKTEGLREVRIPVGKGIVGICAQEKKPIIVNDAEKDERIYRQSGELAQFVTKNLIAIPLLIESKCIGVLEVINTIGREKFTQEDLNVFESFSDSVAIAMHRKRLTSYLEESNRQLGKKLNETMILHSISEALLKSETIETMFEEVGNVLKENLSISYMTFLFYSSSDKKLIPFLSRGLSGKPMEDSVSDLALEIFQKKVRLRFVQDRKGRKESKYINFLKRNQLSSCIFLLLQERENLNPYGVFCALYSGEEQLTGDDIRLLSTVMTDVSRGYQGFLHQKEIAEKRTMQKEIEIASRIQSKIIPEDSFAHNYANIAGRAVMAQVTGGDFYFYHSDDPDSPLGMMIGDVSGKSLPAAIFMAVASSVLKTIVDSVKKPSHILRQANDLLYKESDMGMFTTLFFAYYEPQNNTIFYSSAGHNEMLLLRKDGSFKILSCRGKPLGVAPTDAEGYGESSIRVASGDLLVLYTDGVTEAVNPEGEEFGLERLVQFFRENRDYAPFELVDMLYKKVLQFSRSEQLTHDDFTVLICCFQENRKTSPKTFHFRLSANKEGVKQLCNNVESLYRDHIKDSFLINDLLVVTEEAAANIVFHAYAEKESSKNEFECIFEINTDTVRLIFHDTGHPFPMQMYRSPNLSQILASNQVGGFGVHLMRSIMDHVVYKRKDGMNILHMEKKLKLSR